MGYIWSEIPKEYKPDPSKWKIEGTPFEDVQKRLNAKGLHNPWLRNEVWIYSMSRTHYTLKHLFSRGLIPGFGLFCGALAIESEGLATDMIKCWVTGIVIQTFQATPHQLFFSAPRLNALGQAIMKKALFSFEMGKHYFIVVFLPFFGLFFSIVYSLIFAFGASTRTVCKIGYGGLSLPLFGFAFALSFSLLFAFGPSTRTHCGVPNYLPSVSAAIALTPQAYVWRTCIGLHTPLRYLLIWMYNAWMPRYKSSYPKLFKFLCTTAIIGGVAEISCLMGLSVVSSTENFEVHEFFFIFFITGAFTHMIVDLISKQLVAMETPRERQLLKRKVMFFSINLCAFLASMYFYVHHNNSCIPLFYTYFALCEYIVILSNIGYHTMTMLELCEYRISAIQLDGVKVF